jgi:hypothetical protein
MSDDQGIGYWSEYWTNQTWYDDEAHADRGLTVLRNRAMDVF